jgi:hypothetical protein
MKMLENISASFFVFKCRNLFVNANLLPGIEVGGGEMIFPNMQKVLPNISVRAYNTLGKKLKSLF